MNVTLISLSATHSRYQQRYSFCDFRQLPIGGLFQQTLVAALDTCLGVFLLSCFGALCCCPFGQSPPLGVAAPTGLPVGLSVGFAPRLAGNRRLAAVPALAEFPGSLQAFLCIEPLVLYALWTLVPDLFVLPAVFVCVASLGRGCFLMGAAAVRLLDAAFRLLRTAGPDGRVFPSFRCRILAGVGCFGAVPFALGSPWQGKRELESSSFHPLRREPRPTKLHPTAYVLRILTPNRCWL